MDENERFLIISALKNVDKVFISIDKDKTQRATLKYIANKLKNFDLLQMGEIKIIILFLKPLFVKKIVLH